MNIGLYILGGCVLLALGVMLKSRGLVQVMIAFMGLSLSISGCYLMLGAHFLAAMQIMVYVGGILVLMAYALMLSADSALSLNRWHLPAALRSVVLMGLMLYAIVTQKMNLLVAAPADLNAVGLLLIKQDSIIWELTGLLLLLVLLGVVRLLAVFRLPSSTSISSDE